MRIGVMVTNGGPHPPDMWADQSADRIVDLIKIAPTFPKYDEAMQQRNILRQMIRDTMLEHHQTVQEVARSNLAVGANHMIPAGAALGEAVRVVQQATVGTMFEEHFHKPEIAKVVEDTLRNHLNTVAHIEHSWHRDRQGA